MPPGTLAVGDFGDDVARLHERLKLHGVEVSADERKRKFFGPSTREAVGDIQKTHGIDPTCEVCDETSALLGKGPGAAATAPSSPASGLMGKVSAIGTSGGGVTNPSSPISLPSTPPASGAGNGGGAARVSGVIALEHGLAASKLKVRLYQRGFGGTKALLQESETTEQGTYDIPYRASEAANFEVYAVGADGKEVQLSRTRFGAGADERLDLIAPSALQPPAAEFSRLKAAIAPHLGGKPEMLKGAIERGNRRDISSLVSPSGWDGRALALASLAYEHADLTAMPAEGLYALYRAGFPADPKRLARIDGLNIKTALNQAAQAGIIDSASVEAGSNAFNAFAAAERLKFKAPGKLSSLGDFVTRAPVSTTDRTAFTALLKEGDGKGLWSRAKSAGVSEEGIATLQLQGQLAYLTLNNADLSASLQPKLTTGDVRQLIELDFDQPATWVREITALAGGDDGRLGALIPPAIEGHNNQDRLNSYSEELARRVRQMDANRVTMRQLARGDLDGISTGARDGVQTFLANATMKQFRLGQTAMSSFLSEHGEDTLLPGMTAVEKTAAMDEVKSLHRLYSLSISDKTLNVLRKKGFKSAHDITRLPYLDFLRLVEPEIGSTRETREIYWKAQQQSATIVNVFTGAKQLGIAPPVASMGGRSVDREGRIAKAKEKLVGRYPTLESLFGNVDYCECEHCKSVLSQPAYLVDILHFIDPKEPQWGFQKALWAMAQAVPDQDYEATHKKPFDALVARRPDIPHIALTCENTNTALPYIDIVNENLELLVAGGVASVKAFDTGTANSQDLIAEPQNITWEAYVGGGGKHGLNEYVYPTKLPFDLPLESVRAFLQQFDIPLWKLRQLVGRPKQLNASTGNAIGLADVWFERLGLGPADIKVLTGGYPWYELYGYADESTALADLSSAKTLSRRLGVTYKELVELLKTGFVNPALDNLAVLRRLAMDPHDVERYFNPPPDLSPAERAAFKDRVVALNLSETDVKALWSETVRENVLLLRSPEVGCDFSQTTLSFAKASTNGTASMILALLKLNVFVRLQKQLGWTTSLLDGALRVFIRPSVSALTFSGWADAMRTALMYLAHLDDIATRTEQRVSYEELLTLWDAIPATGSENLYERLFLNRGMLARDPVFDHPLGRYLEGSKEPIDAHIDGITQALQMSHEEITETLEFLHPKNAYLSLENLSSLMRHKVLARALDMSLSDLLTYLSLSSYTPMQALSQAPVRELKDDVPFVQTLAFIRQVELVRTSGLDAAVLEGLCRHQGAAIDLEGQAEVTDRVLVALSALPKLDSPGPSDDPNETARYQEAQQRDRLAVIQTLAAQLGAPEALLSTLVTSVLRDPASGAPLIEGALASRITALPPSGTTWSWYLWFAATGPYLLSTPTASNAALKFGAKDDLQPVAKTVAKMNDQFVLAQVGAAQRYRLELRLSTKGTIALQGDAVPTGISVEEYTRFSMAISRLHKALVLLTSLEVSETELSYIRSLSQALSLDALPIAMVTDDNVARDTFKKLLPWIDLASARRQYAAGDRVVAVLRSAKRSYDAPDKMEEFDAELNRTLSLLTGWKSEFVQSARRALAIQANLTSVGGTSVYEASALSSAAGLQETTEACGALIRLGVGPDDVVRWSTATIDKDVASKVRAALKGRYAPSAWRRLARPIFDILRKKQRDALVAYLTHLPGEPYGATLEQLFEHLLYDPGTEPPVLASRIQLAISSVQLFVQRCLMNLEEDVLPSIIDAKRWEWMSRYRIWEVNRKIYIWAENWADQEFRDDKTYLFRELEGSLLQGDVSEDLVRTALFTYLQGLESIARLEMMTMYFEPGASADSSIVHVIGRTPQAPFKYFYRRCAHRMWTPWEPVGFEIDGEHLALTVWRGRMHLFWVTFFEKAQENKTPVGAMKDLAETPAAGLKADKVVQLQLNWVEYLQGSWQNRSSTQNFIDAIQFMNAGASDPESRRKFAIHVKVDPKDPDLSGDDILELHIWHTGMNVGQKFIMFSKLAPPKLDSTGGIAPTPGPMTGISPIATKWVGSSPLAVTFTADDTQTDGVLTSSNRGSFHILDSEGGYQLLFPSNELRLDVNEVIPRAVGQPSCYVFVPQGAQHVVYRGPDCSIHDVWWTPNGWFHTNASAAAGSEPAAGDPHGYPLDDQHMHCVAYYAERKLLELSWSQVDSLGPDADEDVATAWRVDTLYEASSDAQRPVGRPLGGMFTPKRGVIYRVAGGLFAAVEGAATGSWDRFQLNAGAVPGAASNPSGLMMTETALGVTTILSRHIFYRGTDGHLHELRSDAAGTAWSHFDLTTMTGAPPPAVDAHPGAYAFLGQKNLHVVYRDQDGVVHELWGPVGTWNHNPIGSSFGKAGSDPIGYVTEFAGTQHVVYRGVEGHVHELWWSWAGWQENILTQTVKDAPLAEGDLAGYSFERQNTQHVVYRAKDGGLRELWWSVDGWHLGQYALATPYADPIGPLIAPFFYEDQMAPHTFFVEPSLAEKTVHDWKEYVVTTEEYVKEKPPLKIDFKPWFPHGIELTPSTLGVVPAATRIRDRIFEDNTLLKTSKGLFDNAGGAKSSEFSQVERSETNPKQVVDLVRGLGALQHDSLRTISLMKRGMQ